MPADALPNIRAIGSCFCYSCRNSKIDKAGQATTSPALGDEPEPQAPVNNVRDSTEEVSATVGSPIHEIYVPNWQETLRLNRKAIRDAFYLAKTRLGDEGFAIRMG
jgi:hypothetical protein